MDNTKELRVISLCTGYGGLDEGIRRAIYPTPLREVAIVEIEAFAIANLVKKMESGEMDAAPIWSDLKTFPSQYFRGKVHGITGGYPCQPFSHAGGRKGTDDPRHLWPYIREIVAAVRPIWCFFENVEGHLTLGYDEVYRSLRDLGYTVEAGIFSAEEIGAPHKRKRLFILAVLENSKGNDGRRIGGFTNKRKGKNSEGFGTRLRDEFSGSSEFADPQGSNEPRQHNGQGQKQSSEDGEKEELAHSKGQGLQGCRESHIEERREEYTKDGGGVQRGITDPSVYGESKELADTDNSRSRQDREPTELRTGSTKQPPGNSRKAPVGQDNKRRFNGWPSRPGQQQHEWEHPRTATKEEIKSAMGVPVDGDDFRTDLLRALGNGVVPATAKKAWIELWKKMERNLNR